MLNVNNGSFPKYWTFCFCSELPNVEFRIRTWVRYNDIIQTDKRHGKHMDLFILCSNYLFKIDVL